MNASPRQFKEIRIASPCSADWNVMTGDERARFCQQCQKHVYNLSALTQAQVQALIVANEGKFCARFYRRADGTMLTADCPVGLKALRQRAAKYCYEPAGARSTRCSPDSLHSRHLAHTRL